MRCSLDDPDEPLRCDPLGLRPLDEDAPQRPLRQGAQRLFVLEAGEERWPPCQECGALRIAPETLEEALTMASRDGGDEERSAHRIVGVPDDAQQTAERDPRMDPVARAFHVGLLSSRRLRGRLGPF
jgi:hypothetical protein